MTIFIVIAAIGVGVVVGLAGAYIWFGEKYRNRYHG